MNAAADDREQEQREPERVRQRECDEADAERHRRDGDHAPEAEHRRPRREVERAGERADARRRHEKAERVRSAVQDAWMATAGMSTVYGIPIVLTSASSSSTVRTGTNPDT